MTSNSQKNILTSLQQAQTSSEYSALLKKFYHETSSLVYAFCRKKGLSQEDTEEITQIVYIQIFNKRLQYNPQHSPLAWLYIITRSEAKDFLKARKTYQSYVTDFFDFVSQNQVSIPSTLQSGLNTVPQILETYQNVLTENELSALKLRYNDEKEFQEIARELKTSPLNIRKMISRGIKKMKERSS